MAPTANATLRLAIPVAALTIAVVGLLMERVFLRPLGFDPLRQVLLTVGFAFLFQQGALDIWGGDNLIITPPAVLEESAVIARDRSRVTIRDPARLAALARGDEGAVRGGGSVT